MSAWNGSDRSARLPADWSKRRAEVKRRAGGQCQARLPRTGARCPRKGVECDHIRPGDDHSYSNLQWLCHHHHEQKTIRERPQPFRRKRIKAPKKPEERHPGLRHGSAG